MGPDDPIFAQLRAIGALSAAPNGFGVQAYQTIDLIRDIGFNDFLRGGNANEAGATLSRASVMRNPSVKRCVNLISSVMGMLPCHLLLRPEDGEQAQKATDHPLYPVLSLTPNSKQDAYQFRKLLQRHALIDGSGYAEILRGRNKAITGLVPIHPSKVKPRDAWDAPYKVARGQGSDRLVKPEDMFHLYGDSDDGLNGISLVDEAGEALGLSIQADTAAARLFRVGSLIRDVLSKDDGKLSPAAVANLKAQMTDEFGGAANAHKTLVLEEGLKYTSVQNNAKDSQHLETRQHQVHEIARIFGVPRTFLMVDDTSWGTGIEQLGIFFVQYAIGPWMKAWESAISRLLLTQDERREGYYPKFNERALLRGSMTDQANFLSSMMGSGGSPQIMEVNEARALLDLPDHPDGSGLNSGVVNDGEAEDGTTRQDQA